MTSGLLRPNPIKSLYSPCLQLRSSKFVPASPALSHRKRTFPTWTPLIPFPRSPNIGSPSICFFVSVWDRNPSLVIYNAK
ncbi:hypothetical protein L596_027808 [Steinernema carpocapsae]|uniref:Uncharacterized protein n=1 Tax=Steinernema carpocapsae TaxID=34508 RepID=A0A4U5LWK4_STECR|nr:hypothetical protein L596_027808 [Steinernema carpocapsae]